MTQLKLLLFLFCAVPYACGQRHSTNSQNNNNTSLNKGIDTTPKTRFYPDTSIIAILPADKEKTWLFKDATTMKLTNEDLNKIEQLLSDCINKHNVKQDSTKLFSEYIDLKKYRRQYVPFMNSTGERKVYINCFCNSDWGFDYWKKKLVEVDDGGGCFFQLFINLTTLKCEHFSTNGYG
jgi:hypothetical protein